MTNQGGTIEDYYIFENYLISAKQDFVSKVGNFSCEINYEGEKYFFTNEKRNYSIFNTVKSLKSDLIPHLDFFKTKRQGLQYYFLRSDLIEQKKEFYCVDIKRAYPSCLELTGFISEKTKGKIEKLEKKDKLAVCGMLAYDPDLFYFEGGKFIDHKKASFFYEDNFSSCFFYCVKKIQDLMLLIINELQNQYFFTWVDGIFFPKDDKLLEKVLTVIRKNSFECSTETCTDLKTEIKEHTLHVSYLKQNGKSKSLNFPSVLAQKRKYQNIDRILSNQNHENFTEQLRNNFVLDENGNILF